MTAFPILVSFKIFSSKSQKNKILKIVQSVIQVYLRIPTTNLLYDRFVTFSSQKENMDTKKNPGLSNSIVEFYRHEYFNFAHCALKKIL